LRDAAGPVALYVAREWTLSAACAGVWRASM